MLNNRRGQGSMKPSKDFLNLTKIVDQQTTNISVAANADDR